MSTMENTYSEAQNRTVPDRAYIFFQSIFVPHIQLAGNRGSP
jgi:hypothetical protein